MVRFYLIDPGPKPGHAWTGELWMHPAPEALVSRPVEGLLPPRLVADYRDAIHSYDHGIWRAAAQQSRVVMEGVVKTLLTEEGAEANSRAPLAGLLKRLAESKDLAQPINDLSEILREGGNLAAHFDAGREVTPEMAREMLDLLGAFLDYLILTPQAVTRLRRRLESETSSE